MVEMTWLTKVGGCNRLVCGVGGLSRVLLSSTSKTRFGPDAPTLSHACSHVISHSTLLLLCAPDSSDQLHIDHLTVCIAVAAGLVDLQLQKLSSGNELSSGPDITASIVWTSHYGRCTWT